MSFPYNAEAQLNDGSAVLLDLEKTGWAYKEMLAQTHRFSLVPKSGTTNSAGNPLPIVVVNIPPGAKPIYRSRVYRKMGTGADGQALIEFRCFCIGWKKGSVTCWTWILPSGDIETGVGDDSWLADLLFDNLTTKLAP
jgi:hypothetical protein